MTTRTRTVSDEPLITCAEVARRLAMPLPTFYDQRKRNKGVGQVKGFKIGGQIKYRWSEVAAWLEQQRETS